ncbi:MAG: hypothetical protein WD114_03060 [Phycisphaerales bacterium]
MRDATVPSRFDQSLDELAGALGRWMIFASGLTILVAALLLPAHADLQNTRVERDHTLHIERTHERRIERYQAFLNQLASPDRHTIDLLAMSQLGMIPQGRQAIVAAGEPGDINLIEFIEPDPVPFQTHITPPTRLEALTTSPKWRLWVIAGALFAVMYGLMPATKP